MSTEALETLWASRGIDAASLALRADGTLALGSGRGVTFGTSATLLQTTSQEIEAFAFSPEPLVPGDVLGRGGMGEVREAEQSSLRRSVAIKTVLDPQDALAVTALLKEAWVGGALEHPHITPVHALARDGGSPAMVMKRIEGESWADRLAAGGHGAAHLEANLRLLVQVCQAIEFAHAQGVLHLDLKPDNVMLGAFGEVYVVDWGLAAGLEEGPAWLDPASAIDGVAGTPGFMAPELVAADGASVDQRTDVYLLGGILHAIVTGEERHQGESLLMQLSAALVSAPPAYPAWVPAPLVAILHRATHATRDARFPSAAALREAIETFLAARDGDRILARGRALLDEARALPDDASDAVVEPRLAECEHAVALAAAEGGVPERAQALQREVAAFRFDRAIRRGRPEDALAVLALLEVDGPSPERQAAIARCRAQLAERAERLAHLEQMRRELDVSLGQGDRRTMFLLLGVIWASVNVLFGWLTRSEIYPIGYRELLLEGVLLVVGLVPLGIWRRRTLFANRANRRLYGGLIITAIAVELFWLASLQLGLPLGLALTLTPLFYTFCFAALAVAVDRRLAGGALCLALTALATGLWPLHAYECVGVGGLAAVTATILAWRSRATSPS